MPPPPKSASCTDSPATLVAILRAARICGDRDLEREAKRELLERFGIRVTFDAKAKRRASSCN